MTGVQTCALPISHRKATKKLQSQKKKIKFLESGTGNHTTEISTGEIERSIMKTEHTNQTKPNQTGSRGNRINFTTLRLDYLIAQALSPGWIHQSNKRSQSWSLFAIAVSTMMKFIACVAVVLCSIDQGQAFKLQRSNTFRKPSVLFSGDAAMEKLHLEPIAKISGEVMLEQAVASWYFSKPRSSFSCTSLQYYQHNIHRSHCQEANHSQTASFS